MRDPSTSWSRLRTLLGVAAWALPRTPFMLLSEHGPVPSRVEAQVEPNHPLVALLCGADKTDVNARAEEVVAWHADDPDRLPRIDPDRFVLAAPTSMGSVRFLRLRAGGVPSGVPLGIASGFFVFGAREESIAAHTDHLVRRLAKVASELDAHLDVRIDVEARPAARRLVDHALDGVAAWGKSLDASSSAQKTSMDVAAWVAALQVVKASGPLRFDISLGDDAVHVVATQENRPSVTLEVPGEVVRSWATGHLGDAIGKAFGSPF